MNRKHELKQMIVFLLMIILMSLSAYSMGYAPTGILGTLDYDGDMCDLEIKLLAVDQDRDVLFESEEVGVKNSMFYNQVTTLVADGMFDIIIIITFKDGSQEPANLTIHDVMPWDSKFIKISLVSALDSELDSIVDGEKVSASISGNKESKDYKLLSDAKPPVFMKEAKDLEEFLKTYDERYIEYLDLDRSKKPEVNDDFGKEKKKVSETPTPVTISNIKCKDCGMDDFYGPLLFTILIGFVMTMVFVRKKILVRK